LARVRSVVVGERRYLQVVESKAGSISVLHSFGEYNVENWLKANHFASSYNQLRELVLTRSSENPESFLHAALATFGVVLGAAVVASIIAQN